MGNKNSMTIHRLLYDWHANGHGGFIKIPKDYLNYRLVVCDEVGMVSSEMVKQLLKHKNCYIIFSGDPAQLSPIDKKTDNHLLDHPHIFLQQIVRQALDSDIVKVSMDVRNGKPLEVLETNEVKILNASSLSNGILNWADIIICSTNKVRNMLNQQVNIIKGFPNNCVVDGQRIICLRNYWDILSDKQEPLVNGVIGVAKNVKVVKEKLVSNVGGGSFEVVQMDLVTECNGTYYNVKFDKQRLLTGVSTFTDKARISRINGFYNSPWAVQRRLRNPLPLDGEFGWAITCWKAQGSTYDKVLVIEEGFPGVPDEHQRWIYTACTRPSKKLVFIKKDNT